MQCRALVLLLLLAAISTLAGASNGIMVTSKGQGPDIVFLPGWGCPGDVWMETATMLAASHRCHLVSIPGFGSPAGNTADFDGWRRELVDWLDREGIRKPVLVGHSLGGVLALRIALETPGRFRAVVMVDAYPFAPALANPSIQQAQTREQGKMLATMLRSQSLPQFRQFTENFLRAMEEDEARRARIQSWMEESSRDTLAAAQEWALSRDLRPDLKSLDVPVALVGSLATGTRMGLSRDSLRKAAEDQFRLSRSFRVVFHETAGHFILLDDPEGLARILAEIIRP